MFMLSGSVLYSAGEICCEASGPRSSFTYFSIPFRADGVTASPFISGVTSTLCFLFVNCLNRVIQCLGVYVGFPSFNLASRFGTSMSSLATSVQL